MKINRTLPEESTQWQADAPSVKAMRMILPIAGLLSATSLAGGIAAFLKLEVTSVTGVSLLVFFAVAAWHFDGLAVSSGQSVVRDFILGKRKEIEMGTLFWINLTFAALICGATVFGSFHMSRNGVSFLVLEVRKAKEIRSESDTTLNKTIAGATDQNGAILDAKKAAHEAQIAAINATYTGKVEALEADIQRRQNQRNNDNYQYIDNKISQLRKEIGEVKAARGEELAALAATFAAEQSRILAGNEDLQSVVVADAKAASERMKIKQLEKDQADKLLSGLVASIFSYSIILMVIISVRLTMLETRNGILPDPVLSNSDVSGATMLLRFVLAVPNFIISCLAWVAEWLYQVAPKHRTPIVDNDLIDFKPAQAKVVALRKEPKESPKKAAAARREIGYRQAGAAATNDGQNGPQMTANNMGANNGNNGPVSTAPENGQNNGEKEIIYKEVDTSLRDCIECGETYRAKAHNQKFCSRNCKTAHHTSKNGGRAFDPAKFHGKKF